MISGPPTSLKPQEDRLIAAHSREQLSAPELLEEFTRTGSQAPYEEVVRRYAGMVYHTCYKVTKNQHDAEDAAQAAFLSLAVQCRAGKSIKAVGPWLQRVGHRLALDIRRSHKRRENRETRHIEMQAHVHPTNGRGFHLEEHSKPTHGYDPQELQKVMHDALQTLPPRYRMPMILHYFGGLSREQIAKELHCKVSTLGVRIHRGREMLRKKLAGRGMVMSIDALTALLAMSVGTSVNQSMIASTSLAASSMAGGALVDPTLISTAVLSLANRAAKAVVMARLKVAVATILLTTPMLFAARPVIDRISEINWQNFSPVQIIQDFLLQFRDSVIPTPLADASPEPFKTPQPVAAPSIAPVEVELERTIRPSLAKPSKPIAYAPTPTQINVPKINAVQLLPPIRTESAPVASNSSASPTPTSITGNNAPAEKQADSSPEMPVMASASSEGGSSNDLPAIHSGSAVPVAGAAVSSKSVTEQLLGDSPTVVTSGLYSSTTGGTYSLAMSNSSTDGTASSLVFSNNTTDAFRGWGTAASTVFEAKGKIVADGFGMNRTLDLSHVTIDTSHDNSPYGGTDGWYAIKTGRLLLPSLHASADIPTITWGESSDDPKLDMVNSARLTFHDITTPSDVSISLIALDSSEHPKFPTNHHFIGVWSIDGIPEHAGMTDLVVRYNDDLAFTMGLPESVLKLWVYTDEGWHRIMDDTFGRDMQGNLIWGSYNGSFTYFAVSAPEPTGLLLLAGAGFMLMRRTRRR